MLENSTGRKLSGKFGKAHENEDSSGPHQDYEENVKYWQLLQSKVTFDPDTLHVCEQIESSELLCVIFTYGPNFMDRRGSLCVSFYQMAEKFKADLYRNFKQLENLGHLEW